MTTLIRAALATACFCALANAQQPLISPLEKPRPENRRDLLAIQNSVKDVAERAMPCTVGVRLGGAMGSGVIISEDGYILTAAHVVVPPSRDRVPDPSLAYEAPGRRVQVLFQDGKVEQGRVLGLHTAADGALIKLDGDGPWPFVPMAEKNAEIGDWCIAIGHPGGFNKERSSPVRLGRVIDQVPMVMRTDCVITGGDSGGPLFDLQGRVIGIHSRITEELDENFHVPVQTYLTAWDELTQGEIYPKPTASRFLTALDENNDGKLTVDEQKSRFARNVVGRLIEQFDLDADEPIAINELVTEEFGWRPATPATLVEIEDQVDLASVPLASTDFVRGRHMGRLLHSDEASTVTARVYSDGRFVALGTIVDSDGYVLTKASRLKAKDDIDCRLSNGKRVAAEIAAVDDEYDLALLRINAKGLPTPNWNDDTGVGTWVAIPNSKGLESVGVVGVAPRRIKPMQPMLGVRIDPEVVSEVLVKDVVSGSGAEDAGVKAGDVILEVAGEEIGAIQQILRVLREYRALDTVPILIRRNDVEIKLDVTLLSDADISFNLGQWRMSGPLSKIRDGFGAAFQVDAPIRIARCGGPIVNAYGQVVGVTLARADRVATYGIDHRTLVPVLRRMRKKANVYQAKVETTREVE